MRGARGTWATTLCESSSELHKSWGSKSGIWDWSDKDLERVTYRREPCSLPSRTPVRGFHDPANFPPLALRGLPRTTNRARVAGPILHSQEDLCVNGDADADTSHGCWSFIALKVRQSAQKNSKSSKIKNQKIKNPRGPTPGGEVSRVIFWGTTRTSRGPSVGGRNRDAFADISKSPWGGVGWGIGGGVRCGWRATHPQNGV